MKRLMVLCAVATCITCGNPYDFTDDSPFVGVWQSTRTGLVDGNGEPYTPPRLYFTKDLKYGLDNVTLGEYAYRRVDTSGIYEITLSLEGETVVFRARIEDNGTRLDAWYVGGETASVSGPHQGDYYLVHKLDN